jgi:hypothetical protein
LTGDLISTNTLLEEFFSSLRMPSGIAPETTDFSYLNQFSSLFSGAEGSGRWLSASGVI